MKSLSTWQSICRATLAQGSQKTAGFFLSYPHRCGEPHFLCFWSSSCKNPDSLKYFPFSFRDQRRKQIFLQDLTWMSKGTETSNSSFCLPPSPPAWHTEWIMKPERIFSMTWVNAHFGHLFIAPIDTLPASHHLQAERAQTLPANPCMVQFLAAMILYIYAQTFSCSVKSVFILNTYIAPFTNAQLILFFFIQHTIGHYPIFWLKEFLCIRNFFFTSVFFLSPKILHWLDAKLDHNLLNIIFFRMTALWISASHVTLLLIVQIILKI